MKFDNSDPHAVRAAKLFDIKIEDVTVEQRQVAKKSYYIAAYDQLAPEYRKALEEHVTNLEEIISEVHGWIVCAAIAPPEDLFQNVNRIAEITAPGFRMVQS